MSINSPRRQVGSGIIGLANPISRRPHRITFENPGPSEPDNDGGFTESWVTLDPPVMASVEPASFADLERIIAGTITVHAPMIVRCAYRPDVTILTRIRYENPVGYPHLLLVVNVRNEEERNVNLTLVCDEQIDTSAPSVDVQLTPVFGVAR